MKKWVSEEMLMDDLPVGADLDKMVMVEVPDKGSPGVERCAVVSAPGMYLCYQREDGVTHRLSSAVDDVEFVGYEYDDGSVWCLPILFEDHTDSGKSYRIDRWGEGGPACPVAVLFEE